MKFVDFEEKTKVQPKLITSNNLRLKVRYELRCIFNDAVDKIIGDVKNESRN